MVYEPGMEPGMEPVLGSPGLLDPAAPPRDLSMRAVGLAHAALAPRTCVLYRSALAGLDRWLAGRPVTDARVAEYCAERHEAGWAPSTVALVVAVALQVGVNYANDYSDGIRGTDAHREGPARLVGGGAVAPALVRRAAFGGFAVAAAAGLALAIAVTLWLVAVGLACVLAAWYYTGGRRPYGYAGFGEAFVFVFFGVPVGLLASALLVANNLRDIPRDRESGKLTLAVRLGERGTAWLYAALVLVAIGVAPLLGIARSWAPLSLASLPLAVPAVRLALSADAKSPLLNHTARLHSVFGLLLTVGLALSA